ncbi:NAD(P)H-binding protein [Nocardiopsis sp. RSe5-2]|uniref:NAD(P)H-binding protein n=1 Tax=Nocardiopsis endophytica TaxID=3018445 RepID=A0ABT4UEL2_9ACTN|nr:NAD(P)H-binding protein [Nocardiopsis endophytica]MDA2814782.1 NAD(P)H-binding protein [Nocardiopsis endophytica]
MNDHRDDNRDAPRDDHPHDPRPVLVTGPAGNVGRHVAALLAERGVPLRLLAHRTPPPAPPGAEVVHGDLADPATLRPALAGVRAVFLQWPLPDASGAREAVAAVAEHAPLAVYLSSAGIDDGAADQPDPVNRRHAAVERDLARSGLAWTRCAPEPRRPRRWSGGDSVGAAGRRGYDDVNRTHPDGLAWPHPAHDGLKRPRH